MNDQWLEQYWWLVVLFAAWELGWKGWALWKASKKDEKAWFVILLLINTAGLLPLAYIFIFSKEKSQNNVA